MVPFYLVTGFLGAGKTTFLKHIINHNAGGKKIAIIQNEFSAVNIDARELDNLKKPFKILEINNGSVFCVCLLGDFIASLNNFLESEEPDIVVLETSGLSDPVAITEILQSPKLIHKVYLSTCFCIVDVLNYEKLNARLNNVRHQIIIADVLILNKVDLVDNETLNQVKRSIGAINAIARMVVTEYCKTDTDLIFKTDHTWKNSVKPGSINTTERQSLIKSSVFRSNRKINLERLNTLLQKYATRIPRIKGYALLSDNTTVSVQTVFEGVNITALPDRRINTVLILLGDDHNLSQFSQEFRKLMD